MRSAGAVITALVEAYNCRWGQWVPLRDLAEPAGLTRPELEAAILDLCDDISFAAEPHPFTHQITDWDHQHAPVIGGEPRHLIRWT